MKRVVTTLAGLALAAACSNPAGPSGSGLSVAGTWQGTALLPNAFSATMTLQQNGTGATGTMRISGAFGDSDVNGTVTPGPRRFDWSVARGCERWSGVLTVDAGGRAMSGPLTIDRLGCTPAQSSGAGTLSLEKQ